MADRNMAMARRIAEAVAGAGGRTYYVGGCVRDRLMGLENKDIDIEVHGVTVPALEAILDGLGQRTAMGASFGIMGLRHYDLDIAMPRSEKATGRGHKDFAVFVDPFIGEEKAALRRDFTMNARMQDVLTGEVLDYRLILPRGASATSMTPPSPRTRCGCSAPPSSPPGSISPWLPEPRPSVAGWLWKPWPPSA